MMILSAARVIGFFATFAIPILLVRAFDQGEFGAYKQAFLVVGTAVPILTMGLHASLYYFVPRDEGGGTRYVLHAQALTTGAAALFGLLVALRPEAIGLVLGDAATQTLLPLVGALIVLSTPAEMFAALPVLDRRPTLAAYAMAASDLLRATTMIGAALVVGTVASVLWAGILNAVLRLVFIVLYLRMRERTPASRWSRSDLGTQVRYAAPFAFAVLLEIGLMRFHEYYVSAHVSTAEYAVYAVGVFQLPLIGLVVHSVIDVVIVRMAAAYKAGERAVMRLVWNDTVARLASILVPCWVLAELTAPQLIGVLFGDPYLAAVPVFRVFVSSLLLWMIIDHGILRATSDMAAILRANVAGIVVSVLATVVLGRGSVTFAAVVGYLLGLATMRLVGLAFVARRLGLGLHELMPVRVIGRVAAAALGAALPAALVQLAPFPPLLSLICVGTAYATCYLLLGIRLGVIPADQLRALIARLVPVPSRS